jgi:hypothetical protein
MKRKYRAVIAFEGGPIAKSTPRTLARAHEWIKGRRKFYRDLFERRAFEIYLVTESQPSLNAESRTRRSQEALKSKSPEMKPG